MEGIEGKYAIRPDERFSEYVYRVMRDRIIKCELVPGTPLNEAKLAESFQVSRTPIHEALAKLRGEDLVDILPRKESRVSRIDLVRVNDGIFIRGCVEPELINTIQGNLPAPIMHRMLQNIHRQKQILQEGNRFNEFNEVDDEFHKLLYLATNRENTYAQLRRMVTHFDRVRYLARTLDDFAEIDASSYAEHREIFSIVAYRSKPEMDAHALIRGHITRFQKYMEEIMDRFGDYFTINSGDQN